MTEFETGYPVILALWWLIPRRLTYPMPQLHQWFTQRECGPGCSVHYSVLLKRESNSRMSVWGNHSERLAVDSRRGMWEGTKTLIFEARQFRPTPVLEYALIGYLHAATSITTGLAQVLDKSMLGASASFTFAYRCLYICSTTSLDSSSFVRKPSIHSSCPASLLPNT